MDPYSPTSLYGYPAFDSEHSHFLYLDIPENGKHTFTKMEDSITPFSRGYEKNLGFDHESLEDSVSSLSQDEEHSLFDREISEDPILNIPDDCGHRLVPAIVDDIAARHPQKTFISLAKTSNPMDGFEDITYHAFARAIDRCAWWIEKSLGRSSTFQTLFTYLEPQDLRHGILVLAAIKTGYKMFFSSPANSIETHCSLLQKLECKIYLAPQPNPSVAQEILESWPMRSLSMPQLDEWLHDSDFAKYPYTKSYVGACRDPMLVLHSSGSTGLPKLLTWTHGTWTPNDSYQKIPSLGGRPWQVLSWKGKRVLTSFPWFHAAGILFLLPMAIFDGFIPVIVPAVPKVTAEIANAVHLYGDVQASLFSPAVLVDAAKNPTYVKNLSLLESVNYAGGPLSQRSGDLISVETKVNALLGSTESGYLPTETAEREDWNCFKFDSRLGHELRAFGDGMYELFIVRRKELESFQGVFFTFPELEEYSMRDLYYKHPTKEGWWCHCGRADDVIVFLDARKLHPVMMEAAFESHPSISSAIIYGHARSQPAVLVEPATYPDPATPGVKERMLQEIWPHMARVIEKGPASGKIVKELVVFTSAEKPLPRAGGKGTILRKRTLELYQEEFDQAYADQDLKLMAEIVPAAELNSNIESSLQFEGKPKVKRTKFLRKAKLALR